MDRNLYSYRSNLSVDVCVEEYIIRNLILFDFCWPLALKTSFSLNPCILTGGQWQNKKHECTVCVFKLEYLNCLFSDQIEKEVVMVMLNAAIVLMKM